MTVTMKALDVVFTSGMHVLPGTICIAELISVQQHTGLSPFPFTFRFGQLQSLSRYNGCSASQPNKCEHIYILHRGVFSGKAHVSSCLVSFFYCGLVLYIIWMLMRNGNSTAFYLINLSISDLLYTISLPVWIELALQRPLGGLCSLVAVIMHNSFYIGLGLLCCLSVDRYLAVVYPLHFHWVREVHTAAVVSIAVWTLEIAIHIILLDHRGALQAFSSRSLCEERMPMTQEDAHIALTRVTLGFLVPVFIMTFCFQQIMWSLRQSNSIQSEERRKVGLLLFFLILTYIVAFMPYQTVMLLRAILEPGACIWTARLRDLYLVTVAMTTINSTADPIIYCLISETAQKEIRKALEKCWGVFVRRKWSESSYGIQSVS